MLQVIMTNVSASAATRQLLHSAQEIDGGKSTNFQVTVTKSTK